MERSKTALLIILTIGVLITLVFIFPKDTSAQELKGITLPAIPIFEKPISEMTISELQAKIQEILTAIQQLQALLAQLTQAPDISGIPSTYSFNTNLRLRDYSKNVQYLQIFLNQDPDTQISQTGWGSPSNESMYFGPKTFNAVSKFQEKYKTEVLTPIGLSQATGYVGQLTRAKINHLLQQYRSGVALTPTPTPTPTTISTPTLSVDLKVSLYSTNWQHTLTSTAPINNLDLRAIVSGTATGTINYMFDCTNDGIWDSPDTMMYYKGVKTALKDFTNKCNYPIPGTYTAKVRVERNTALPAEDTASIIVTSATAVPAPTPAPTPTPYCGDNTCNGTETCSTCPADCGQCPTPSPTNNSPILNSIGNKSVNENSTLTFIVSGTDPDNDPLIYSAQSMPSGASFNTSTRTFTWTPTYAQSGTYNLIFIVSDIQLTDQETIIITVIDVVVPVCGDNTCNGTETCSTCLEDCGTCPSTECTLYVDDTGTGTECSSANPCSLDYARQNEHSGDIICLRDGDYGTFTESNINRNDWVTYKADAGHTPILTSISISNGNQNSYLILDGFNITSGVSLIQTSYVKILNSFIRTEFQPIVGYYEPYIRTRAMAIYANATHYITIQGNDVSHCYRGIQLYGGSMNSNWLIKDNIFHRLSEDGMSLPTLTNGIVEGNYIYDHRRFTTSMPILGTKTGDFIPGELLTMPGTDATGIVYNDQTTYVNVYPTSETTFYTYWWADQSRYVVGQDSGATINPINDVDPPHTDGFSMGGPSSNIIIKNNIIDRKRYVGPGSESGQGFKISGSPTSHPSNVTLINNLVISYNVIIYAVDDLYVYNNTFYTSGGLEFRDLGSDVIVNEMYNNIIEKLNLIDEAGKTLQIVNHGNNIFGNNPDGVGVDYPFVVDSSELVNYDIDSLFVDPANGDFHLTETSTAIDFGDPAFAPVADIEGNLRDAQPDAGSYEYAP